MPDVLEPRFWDDFERDAFKRTARLLFEIFLAGGQAGERMLPPHLRVLLDWELFNLAAVDYLDVYQLNTIPGISETIKTRSIDLIQRWIRGGEPLDALVSRLDPLLGSSRAKRIAVTEVTRTYAAGNISAWKTTGLVTQKVWQTAVDERVCFPAGVMVKTITGERPIEKVLPGDLVMSSSGYRKVIATSKREYSGEMTVLVTDRCSVISTSNHPVWSVKQGWLNAGDFHPGDLVQLSDNQSAEILGVINFPLSNANNHPSVFGKVAHLFDITRRVLMPVIAVNLKRYLSSGYKKVNAVSANLTFLNKRDLQGFKREAHSFLKQGFSGALSVARKRTKLPVFIKRFNPHGFTASLTRLVNRRAATFLRAVVTVQPLFGGENFTAPFARNALCFSGSTLTTANSETISDSSRNREGFSANRTNFIGEFLGAISLVALTRTEPLPPVYSRCGSVKGFSAPLADQPPSTLCADVVALARAISVLADNALNAGKRLVASFASVGKRHIAQLQTNIDTLYHMLSGSIDVYNLQVEGDPTYYANGVLVHNCPICGPLHDQVVALDGSFGLNPLDLPPSLARRGDEFLYFQPPAHPNCRCWLKPVVSEESLREQLRKELG